jgi:hypothetical protein
MCVTGKTALNVAEAANSMQVLSINPWYETYSVGAKQMRIPYIARVRGLNRYALTRITHLLPRMCEI